MKTLILDTSSQFLFVSLVIDGKEIYQKVLEGKNNHSEKLMPVIEEAFHINNLEVKDLDRIIVGIGPGSYTGLRISLVIAKMFSWTKNVDLYTISSLDILGSGYFINDGIYTITNIAKKNYLYTKIIKIENNIIEVIDDDDFILEEEFMEKIKCHNYHIINSNNYRFSGEVIEKMELTKINDIHSLIPNYLRKVM